MKVLNIVKYNFIKTMRDKTALFFIILLPVIFTVVTGTMFANVGGTEEVPRIPVGVTNHDSSGLGINLLDELGRDSTLNIMQMDEQKLYGQVKGSGIEVGFIIPENFGERVASGGIPEIEVLKLPSSVDYMAIEGILNTKFLKLQQKDAVVRYVENKLEEMDIPQKELILAGIEEKVLKNLQKEDVVKVDIKKYVENMESTEYHGQAQIFIGYIVMFVMFTIIFSSGEILEEKKINTWGRMSTTPTSAATIMMGKVLGTYLIGWAQVIFLILFGRLVMGISWGNSLPATVFLMGVYLMTITGMGLFMSSLVKTNAQLGAFSPIVIVCTTMISGCWWPVEFQPVFMQRMAVAFPQYWAMKGLTSTMVANMGIQSVVRPVLVLALIGGIFFALSILAGKLRAKF